MHAIGFIELGEYDKAAEMLDRSYKRYVEKPFNVKFNLFRSIFESILI